MFPKTFPPSLLWLPALTALFLIGCQKSTASTEDPTNTVAYQAPQLPATPFNYANPTLPNFLTTPPIQGQINTPANNPITDRGATLGRVLFYDVLLSANNKVSCASCHMQAFSFSDTAQLSLGFNGGLTDRNSMSLVNTRYYPNGRFFWDERAASAEAQASGPITHPVEMGMSMPGLVNKLKGVDYYPALFEDAFGSSEIDSARIVRALAQFVRSIVSYQSKYDVGRAAFPPNQNPAQVNFPNFTAQENQGKGIFFGPGRCAGCHGTETFSSPPVATNNGLDNPFIDNGVGAALNNPQQNGAFKVPSIKNVALSFPYMHDGRFQTLEQVVEHYNSQVKPHPNLSPILRNPDGSPRRLNLSADQKAALVAFLHTLTDNAVATDEKFSNPF